MDILGKTKVKDFDPMAFVSQASGKVSQSQRENGIGHFFTVNREEKNLHDELRSNAK
jgi:hypothetical protein